MEAGAENDRSRRYHLPSPGGPLVLDPSWKINCSIEKLILVVHFHDEMPKIPCLSLDRVRQGKKKGSYSRSSDGQEPRAA